MTTEDLRNLKTIHAFLDSDSELAKSLDKVINNSFEGELNELETRVIHTLSELLTLNAGLRFVSKEVVEEGDVAEFGELFEYRDEMSGDVRDFHPVLILEDGQIEGITPEGEAIGGDPINFSQLSITDRIELIDLINEKK